MIRFSLVIPTISRPTLARCLASLRSQDWRPGDEILLVGDGPQPVAAAFWRQLGLPGRYVETPKRLGSWGHGVRNWVNENRLAAGTHLLNLDDDDAYRPGAVAAIRSALSESPGSPHIFRMYTVPGSVTVWADKQVRHGNIGTPMIVAPNDPSRLGKWSARYGGDLDFTRETIAGFEGLPVWRDEIIADIWPAKDIPRDV